MKTRLGTLGLLWLLATASAYASTDFDKLRSRCDKTGVYDSTPCVNLYAAIGRLGPTCQRGVAADCETLAKFARDSNPFLVQSAVRVISDPALLAEMARNPEMDFETRLIAVRSDHLKDQAVLADLARNADVASVRVRAIQKLTDQAVLAELAKNPDDAIAGTAIELLTNRKVLTEIATTGTGKWRPKWARERLEKISGSTTVAGVLVEELTGSPLADYPVKLAGLSFITDGQGRFSLTEVKAGEWPIQDSQGLDLRGHAGTARVQIPPSGRVQLGNVVIRDGAHAGRALGGLCEKGVSQPAAPAQVKLLTFFDEPRGWRYVYGSEKDYKWSAPWQGVLCITPSEAISGTYVDRDTGKASGHAMTAIWSVKLVRLSDGKIFETRLSASPPKQTTGGYGAIGDPTPKLIDWLAKMR